MDFSDPFAGNIPRKMNKEELIRAIRQDIAAEQDAVALYEAHADATDNELAAKVLRDIADEEKEHVGEFTKLLAILEPEEIEHYASGEEEVDDIIQSLGQK